MTFREKPITRLYAFAMAAVFALVLAGCGGGGTTTTDTDPAPMECPAGTTGAYPDCMTPEQIEAQKLQTARNLAMAAYTAAMAAVGSAKDPVAMANAQMYADMAKGASEMAAAATTSAMAEEYQMKAEMYRDNARTASMAAGLGAAMLANMQLNKTPDDVQEPPEPPKPILNTTNVLAAIKTVARATPFAPETGAPTVTVTYDATAKGASITAVEDAFTAGEMPRSFMMDGFMGTELVKSETNLGTDTVAGKTYLVVYSDRAQDTSVTSYATSDMRSADSDVLPTEFAAATTHVTSLSEGQIAGKMGDMIKGTYNADPEDGTPAREGVFYCTLALCTATVNAQGMITANTGYGFRSVSEKVIKMDANYLTLGFWLTAPTALNAAGTAPALDSIAVGAFGTGQTAAEIPAALKGTATYEGIATGLYATKTAINYFKGDAMLEANFGQVKGLAAGADDTVAGFRGSVSGSISNIVVGGVAMSGELGLSDANIAGDATGTYSGNTKGTVGTGRFTGSWRGTFYEAAPTSLPAADQHPLATAGTFSGYDEFSGSSILGAFGANKK